MNNKKYILTLFTLLCSLTYSQVGIGTTTVKPSAILEISSFNNKGVLFPKVDIVDVFNTPPSITNPAEGLIVYNIGNSISPGVYIWQNNRWNLVSDTYNVVNFMMLKSTTPYTILGGFANGTYKNLDTIIYNPLFTFNDIGASINAATGVISLPGSSGYMVSLSLNINTLDESTTGGIAGTPIHVHQYSIKLIDPATGIQYGKTISVNAESNAAAKVHQVDVSFAFVAPTSSSIQLLPAIAHMDGGTYQNGSGGTGANNGAITITTAKLDIQRAVLNQ